MTKPPDQSLINVEVAYALPDRQKIIALDVAEGTTAFRAVADSGIASEFDGIDIENDPMGIFGKTIKPREYQLKAGDRVEIYRPLIADPKAARKARAAASAEAKSSAIQDQP